MDATVMAAAKRDTRQCFIYKISCAGTYDYRCVRCTATCCLPIGTQFSAPPSSNDTPRTQAQAGHFREAVHERGTFGLSTCVSRSGRGSSRKVCLPPHLQCTSVSRSNFTPQHDHETRPRHHHRHRGVRGHKVSTALRDHHLRQRWRWGLGAVERLHGWPVCRRECGGSVGAAMVWWFLWFLWSSWAC